MRRSYPPAPVVDVAVVVVGLLDALLGATPGDPVEWVLSGLAALALVLRRRLPYLVFALTVPTLVWSHIVVAPVLALYAVARYGRGRRALAVCAVVVGAGYVISWFSAGLSTLPSNLILLDVLYGAMIAGAPMFLGLLVNARRDLSQRLHEIDEAREHERQLTAESVLATERARLAREMHDVVSHQVSLIAVQAGALQVSAADPQTRAAAGTIRRLSVDTLDELRHMVSLLRSASSPSTDLAPQPTLADLERLVAGSGIEARLDLDAPAGVGAPVQRAVYRTVQEALTNVRKHAPGATATIGICHDAAALDVTVTNTAPTEPIVPLPSDGHGLVGLRERAELLGGTVQAGPTAAGGFQLRMRVPATDRAPRHP